MKRINVVILTVLLGILASCMNNESREQSGLALIKTTNPNPIVLEKKSPHNLDVVADIENDVKSFKELYDVAIIKDKKDTLVAYKVRHLYRFKMKKIEKDLKEMLEEKYPDEKFIVSSDYKIFLEVVKLKEKMKNPNFSRKKAKKEMEKIIKLRQEMA